MKAAVPMRAHPGPAAARQWCRCPGCGSAQSLALYFCVDCGSRLEQTPESDSRGKVLLGVALACALVAVALMAVMVLTG